MKPSDLAAFIKGIRVRCLGVPLRARKLRIAQPELTVPGRSTTSRVETALPPRARKSQCGLRSESLTQACAGACDRGGTSVRNLLRETPMRISPRESFASDIWPTHIAPIFKQVAP